MASFRNLTLGLFGVNRVTKVTETVQAISCRLIRAIPRITYVAS